MNLNGGKKNGKEKGQAMVEFVAMVGMSLGMFLVLLLLLAAFTSYGARLIGLVGWEPNPPSYTEMNTYVN